MLIIPANSASASGGFNVDNSVRLDGYDSSSRMEKTNSNAGNRQIFTFSTWIKKTAPETGGNYQVLYSAVASAGNERIMFESDKLTWDFDIGGTDYSVATVAVQRDFSAFYHLVVTKDTTQSTEANRVKMYINGVQQTLAEIQRGFPDQNANGSINTAIEHQIFAQGDGEEFGGYACETVLIDGTAYAADSFGEFDEDSGIWKPIDVSGLTFGTNGFYLDYKSSSSLGNDVSGNNNDYTTANLTAVDQSIDTCTNNFCTPNSLYPQRGGGIAFSEGNLKTVYTSYEQSPNGTIGAGAGKWYYEVKMGGTHARFGWCESHCPQGDLDSSSTFPAYAVYSNGSNGLRVYKNVTNRSYSDNSGYTSFSSGKTLGIAFDIDNGKLYAHLNGTYYNSGDPAGGSGALITGITAQQGGLFLPYLNCGTNSSRTFEWNFGSPPYAISSSNADGDGYGNFEYAVPSGFFSINTKNLAEYG